MESVGLDAMQKYGCPPQSSSRRIKQTFAPPAFVAEPAVLVLDDKLVHVFVHEIERHAIIITLHDLQLVSHSMGRQDCIQCRARRLGDMGHEYMVKVLERALECVDNGRLDTWAAAASSPAGLYHAHDLLPIILQRICSIPKRQDAGISSQYPKPRCQAEQVHAGAY